MTTSVCNLFAKPPFSFFTFCPKLANRYSRFVRSDGITGGRGAVTPFNTNGEKRKHGGGNNNKVNHRITSNSGGCGGNSNRGGNNGGNNGGGRGGNDSFNRRSTRFRNNGGNRGGINGSSIINTSGQHMKLPAALSKQYCGHFMDTELR